MPENDQVMETIDDAILYVRASPDDDINPDAKDGLVGQLKAAKHAINGAPDKIQALAELVAIRTVCEVKQTIRLPALIRDVAEATVKAHYDACAGAKVAPPVDPNSKLGIFYACIKSWPLAIVAVVALVAPRSATIIETVFKFFK